MFGARYRDDFKTLRLLHPRFIQTENYPAALLCLDSTFASTLPQRGTNIVNPEPDLSLHFSYFELLNRLRREDQLDPGSVRQRIFAFQSREGDRFFIPTNSYLHVVLAPRSETLREKGGCVVTHEELKRTLDNEIHQYIHLRAKQQYHAYHRKFTFDPCMAMAAGGECSRQDCKFQHIRPEKITPSWFNARIRFVLMEIRILHLASFRLKGLFTCVVPLTTTTPDSDFVRLENGSVSFTPFCTPRRQSSGLSPHSISGTRLNRLKGSGFCKNGSGARVTSFCSAPKLYRSTTSKHLSPTLCLFARWHTTSTSSGHKSIYLVHGCTDTRSGPRASLGQG